MPYEAKRPNSKFCSATCRKRASRGYVLSTPGKVVALGTVLAPTEPDNDGKVEATTLAALAEAERDNTPLGQAALALARRVDVGRDTGAGLAALVKQLEATLRAATVGVQSDASALDKAHDELAARRRA
jgi:hypothetical protein